MKPIRIKMTHNLMCTYGLYKKMEIYRPHPANEQVSLTSIFTLQPLTVEEWDWSY